MQYVTYEGIKQKWHSREADWSKSCDLSFFFFTLPIMNEAHSTTITPKGHF